MLGLKICQNVLDTFPIKKPNSFSLYLAHLGVLYVCFLPKNLTGALLSCLVLIPGSVGSPGGSESAQSVMLLIPGLLDREDELLALQPPQGWGFGRGVGRGSAGMFSGSVLPWEAQVVEASPQGDPQVHVRVFFWGDGFEHKWSGPSLSSLLWQSPPASEDRRCVSGQELEITPLNPSWCCSRKCCCWLIIRK